jgi:SAM-dependent methyltransferase
MTDDPRASCPACGHTDLTDFHREASVPTNSCLLLDDAEEARTFPRGEIRLALCERCGFVFNRVFATDLAEYSNRYEETQGYSAHFRQFARDLAKRWVDAYDLHGRDVLEIGCGKGEFLTYMVEHGAGHGTGIDPGVKPERIATSAADRLTWIADFYSPAYAHLRADAIVCRHTLEHLPDVGGFMTMLRTAIGDRTDTVVLFELPDVLRVLEQVAFWDVYYEHCSYFSAGSLARLFRQTGFEVLDVRLDYDDQYLLIEARPAAVPAEGAGFGIEDDLDRLRTSAAQFSARREQQLAGWRTRLADARTASDQVVIWGGGSKCVAFLNALDVADQIAYVVDINPHKHGRYIAGSDQQVLAPETLRERPADLVIAMNDVYLDEIAGQLTAMGVDAELVAL